MIFLRMFAVSVLVSLSLIGCSASGSGAEGDIDPDLRPMAADTAGQREYVPKDLDECMAVLDTLLHPSIIDTIRHSAADDMIQYHFSIGMWLRNNWGLWRGLRLYQYFWSHGVRHPDEMSGIILDEYWYHLHGERHTIEEAIVLHRENLKAKFNRLPDTSNGSDDAYTMVLLFGLTIVLLYSFL